MIDKVITLADDSEYYVIDELILEDKKYIFAVEASNEKEEIKDNYLICEVKDDNGDMIIDNIYDKEVYEKVSNIFLDNLKR